MYSGRSLQAGRHEETKQPAQAERDQDGKQGPNKCHSQVTGEKLVEPIRCVNIYGSEELAACGRGSQS